MKTASAPAPPPLPPLPHPPPSLKHPPPQRCAIPWSCGGGGHADTNGQQDAQDGAASPQLHPNLPESPPPEGQEDSECDDEEKRHPVQETNPAPQANSTQLSETADPGEQYEVGQTNEAEDD